MQLKELKESSVKKIFLLWNISVPFPPDNLLGHLGIYYRSFIRTFLLSNQGKGIIIHSYSTVDWELTLLSFSPTKIGVFIKYESIQHINPGFFCTDLQYQKKMSRTFGFFFILAMLICSGNFINWQGTGNMSQSNMTQIWNYIRANFKPSWKNAAVIGSGNDTTIVNFTIGFSTHLNGLWDQAWNVVVLYSNDLLGWDTVVYGYAFRDHWMWYNGYWMNDGYTVAFIVWKDYNCLRWLTHNCNEDWDNTFPSTYSNLAPLQTSFRGFYSSLSQYDVWSAAKAYADNLASDPGVKASLGSNIAFSVIVTQAPHACFFGRFCAKHYLANYEKAGSKEGNWGNALILQMR